MTDQATLAGEHATEAEGTVKYDVYSDSECKDLVAEAGEVSVSDGVIPASTAQTLARGTYYSAGILLRRFQQRRLGEHVWQGD